MQRDRVTHARAHKHTRTHARAHTFPERHFSGRSAPAMCFLPATYVRSRAACSDRRVPIDRIVKVGILECNAFKYTNDVYEQWNALMSNAYVCILIKDLPYECGNIQRLMSAEWTPVRLHLHSHGPLSPETKKSVSSATPATSIACTISPTVAHDGLSVL